MIRCLLVAACMPLVLAAALRALQAQDAPPAPPQGVQVDARGPVHEAFAEPAEGSPQPGPVVAQQPPEPINEMPPEVKPEGEDVLWIPGYWDWDDQASQFLWVSGCWRERPPDRKWVPGFWQQVEGGWQRMRGFWAPEQQQEFQYVPQPPETLEQGPSTPQPDADSTYVSGCWIYDQGRYSWRPGFWVPSRPGWVWIPACYFWTPAGCVFNEGYWDHPLHECGLLFAPVTFDRGVLTRNFTYVPDYVIPNDFLLSALFVRRGRGEYWFGDWFEERYARHFIPWIDYRPARNIFDPQFSYYRRQFAREPNWEKNLRGLYTAHARNEVPRPPHTLGQQLQAIRSLTGNRQDKAVLNPNLNLTQIENIQALAPLKQVQNRALTGLGHLAGPKTTIAPHMRKEIRLEELSKEHRATAHQSAIQMREVGQKRQQAEARLLREGKPPRPSEQPRALKLEVPRVHATPQPPAHPAAPGRPPAATVPDRPATPAAPPVRQRPIKERPPAVHPPAHQAPPPAKERPAPPPKPPGPTGKPHPPHSPE